MSELVRFGVSCEEELLSRFDGIIGKRGYPSRSEALRDMIRDMINSEASRSGSGQVIGTLTIVYDHGAGGVTEKLLEIQHHHHAEVSSTLHIHMDEHNCLEVLVLRGEAEDVRHLADHIRAIKDVTFGELVLTMSWTDQKDPRANHHHTRS
jgi:CopG family nickel-responsive transcriptional regulator